MTEPRTPDDQPIDAGTTPATPPEPTAPDAADSPTQACPSLAGPPGTTPPPPAAAATGSTPEPAAPAASSAAPVTTPPAYDPAITRSTPDSAPSGYEPAPSLPDARLGPVGAAGTTAAGTDGTSGAPRASRNSLRWGLAIAGVLIVALASFAIVSLVGGRPSTSTAIGYMPAGVVSYSEVRLDLPGDQRQKLASFLKAFPGFDDQSAIEPKINELLDRMMRAATHDKQTWTNDIKPWFGGQLAFGAGLPDSANALNNSATAANGTVAVATITDRAKAINWITTTGDNASINRETYGGADLFVPADGGGAFAIAVNDKVMIGGSTVAVKAAIDSGGKGTLDQNDDVKAALATLDKDYVVFSIIRIRTFADAAVKLMATSQPGILDQTQLDETILGMVPAWQASTARFENDSIVTSSVTPSWSIGYDAANRPSDVLGHVPAKTLFYSDLHDAGPALTAVLAKFRALPEAQQTFAQVDQALSILGGSEAVYGWWGDTAVVVSALDDGTIGAGLVIHPRDAAVADRLFTTLNGFLALAGGSSGFTTRTEDHNGTKMTIIDFSAMPGISTAGLPPGYKPEFAWASNQDVSVIGYGSSFVAAVLDAGPGKSLADDARFKALLGRVGAENLGVTFLDMAAIRGLIEPLAQAQVPADVWEHYVKEIQPYLKPLDAVISNIRKDGGLDRSSGAFIAH